MLLMSQKQYFSKGCICFGLSIQKEYELTQLQEACGSMIQKNHDFSCSITQNLFKLTMITLTDIVLKVIFVVLQIITCETRWDNDHIPSQVRQVVQRNFSFKCWSLIHKTTAESSVSLYEAWPGLFLKVWRVWAEQELRQQSPRWSFCTSPN